MPNFVRRFFAESLFRNSAFLLINLGVGAVSGYGGLALLTHAFSKPDVGLSATAVSAATLIETITLLCVTYSVPRYLPTAKNRTAMINTLLTAMTLLTLLASAIILALPSGSPFSTNARRGGAREMARFSVGMYFANIIGGLPQMLLPLFALSRIGPTESAYWSIAMSIATILYSLPSMATSALLPEVSLRPTERSQLLRRASFLIVAVVTPALVVVFFAAPLALVFFKQGYTSGTLPVLSGSLGD